MRSNTYFLTSEGMGILGVLVMNCSIDFHGLVVGGANRFRTIANFSSGSWSIIVRSFWRMFIGLKSLFVGYYSTIDTIKIPGE